jgi:hypothetical protein
MQRCLHGSKLELEWRQAVPQQVETEGPAVDQPKDNIFFYS